MTKIGIIGYGYWGPNLVRNFYEVMGTGVKYVCDRDTSLHESITSRYPTITVTTNADDIFNDPEITAVVIATPPATHYPLAMKAMEAGKDVLVEKPIATTFEDAEKMVEAAERLGRILMVDHIFAYTPAVSKIREEVESGALGDIYYFDSVRINLGLFQHDANVIFDLAVHDIGMMLNMFKERPNAVSATGVSNIPGQPENTAYVTFFYDSGMMTHIHVNWLAPVKIRQAMICGSKKMIVFDDNSMTEKLRIYDKGVDIAQTPEDIKNLKVSYRSGDMIAPNIPNAEALKYLASHFLECVETRAKPMTDGVDGMLAVKYMEAATRSMKLKGESQPI